MTLLNANIDVIVAALNCSIHEANMSSGICIFKLLVTVNLLTFLECKPIDLSYVFDNETMYWGNNKRFNHPVVFDGPLKDGNETIVPYLSIYEYEAAEHGGTHMDAPIHFARGKWTLDVIPIENFIGDAVVVNISIKASTNRSAQLTVQDLKDWESVYGAIPNDCIMFVFTGYGKYWLNNEKYFGTNTTNPSLYTFPGKV